jgi:hypothetical protein
VPGTGPFLLCWIFVHEMRTGKGTQDPGTEHRNQGHPASMPPINDRVMSRG